MGCCKKREKREGGEAEVGEEEVPLVGIFSQLSDGAHASTRPARARAVEAPPQKGRLEDQRTKQIQGENSHNSVESVNIAVMNKEVELTKIHPQNVVKVLLEVSYFISKGCIAKSRGAKVAAIAVNSNVTHFHTLDHANTSPTGL